MCLEITILWHTFAGMINQLARVLAFTGPGYMRRRAHPGCRWCCRWCCCVHPQPKRPWLRNGSAILTHPSLSLSGRVSAPSPRTAAPCPAGCWLALRSRCQCSAPLHPCLLPSRRASGGSAAAANWTGPEVNKVAGRWRHEDAANRMGDTTFFRVWALIFLLFFAAGVLRPRRLWNRLPRLPVMKTA